MNKSFALALLLVATCAHGQNLIEIQTKTKGDEGDDFDFGNLDIQVRTHLSTFYFIFLTLDFQ